MAATTYDFRYETGTKAELPIKQEFKSLKKCGREDEFQAALDDYLDQYQRYHAMLKCRKSQVSLFDKLTKWLGN